MIRGALIVATLSALALSGCSTGPSREVIDRALAGAPGEAQPSDIVSTEIAFSREAREDGQWTAFAEYAGDGAVIHTPAGPVAARQWLAQRADPAAAEQWTPTAIWMSCDGETAVSRGRFAQPDNTWGYYATVWKRQRDNSYRWVYRISATDPALTERQRRGRAELLDPDGVIVVEGDPMIRGEVSECTAPMPPPPVTVVPAGMTGDSATSRDRSLVYDWGQYADGRRTFGVRIVQNGAWKQALRFDVGADGEVAQP
ncbi:hypothetical protein [Qipengyuania atrilutea]|uniref:Lipoprotein n=1 Tax=Qipengyuania atrilutea TaxID=2744473 RepID=A0A850H6U6_9SPHN|nr:hypothetical protein [Actirhodobacter atriluteus]NVD44915.1 hypothetical protein [Actirhodobacter atriluteus]